MPFSPLPRIFLEDLRRLGSAGVLELGSGDGRFTALLRERGVAPVTLDRRSPLGGATPLIRGDALRPPLSGRFAIVVAANLLRHVWPQVAGCGPVPWQELVAPGGCLWILEDEPLGRPPAVRNYRDLQTMLAQLLPTERAPLLAAAAFRRRRRSWRWPGGWHDGEEENRWPLAAAPVVAWLQAGRPRPGGEVDRLLAAIRRDGLSCGRCWWTRWQPQEAS
jgi:SAM-dependent methyltransferase